MFEAIVVSGYTKYTIGFKYFSNCHYVIFIIIIVLKSGSDIL